MAKDLRVELRTRERLAAMLLVGVLLLLAFRFAFAGPLDRGETTAEELAPAVLWVSILFVAIIAISSAFTKERDRGTLPALLLLPADRGAIFLGKLLGTFALVAIVDGALLVFYALFFDYGFAGNGLALLGLAWVGSAGFLSAGCLLGAVSLQTRSREVMLPLLLIPLVAFTVLAPAIGGTADLLAGDIEAVFGHARLLAAFALGAATVGTLLAEQVFGD